MGAQVLDITRRMRADWVVAHLFGRSPSVSIKELKKNGFPMDRVISFVWGSGEADMTAAGWDTAQGYLGLQFAGVGRQFPVIEEIMKMHRDGGREVPAQVGSVYYNRGVLVAALMVEAVRLAVEREGMVAQPAPHAQEPGSEGGHVKQRYGVSRTGTVPPPTGPYT